MPIQQILRMDMDGKNCLAKECADILWKIMVSRLELLDIIIFMVRTGLMMVGGKRHLQHCVEKL